MAEYHVAVKRLPANVPDGRLTNKTALYVIGVVILLLAAFVLRVSKLGVADLTYDEVATYYVASRPFVEVLQYVMGAAREHPPVYYMLMNLWMRVVGDNEFVIRFPSVLASVLAVSYSFKMGQRLSGRYGGWWSALLCAGIPFGVWAGRTGRMYALVLLLSLVVMDSWLRWLKHPDWQHWLGFVTLSLVAAMTHYYLVLLWPVQALVLVLLPRRTRVIRQSWLLTLVGVSLFVGVFILISPGIRAMMLEVAKRFPYRGFRVQELRIVFTDLYVWGYRPELSWTGLVGGGLTLLGWVLCARRDRMSGVLYAAWGIVPLVIAHSVPERLESRYLTPIFPALILGLAALLSELRSNVLRILAVAGICSLTVWRLPLFYENSDTTFSTRVETLHAAAEPGDALIMNGPWPTLLLEYYHPPEFLEIYNVPEGAPPGFSEDVDIERLEQILEEHDRIWVSYGAIHWADPQYSVSRWLAENTYHVYQRAGLSLYLPEPDQPEEVLMDMDLGPRLRLLKTFVDRSSVQVGDFIRVGLAVEGSHLGSRLGMTLGLLDMQGNVWLQGDSHFGPVHQLPEAELPDNWRELRGLLLLPGLPPGQYKLALKVEGEDIDTSAAASIHGWIPLSSLQIMPGTTGPNLERLLPGNSGGEKPTGDALTLVGIEPYAANVMQGYLAGVHLWWRAEKATTALDVQVHLVGPEIWDAGTYPLGPEFYPSTMWQAGDVVRQSAFFQLPDALSAGIYLVQVRVLSADREAVDDTWYDVFSLEVDARKRYYYPPLLRVRRDVRFGNVLRLRGYRLERNKVHPGESVNLTVYWQALESPSQIYAIFNHLRDVQNAVVWLGDSWPQAGIYTTDHWQKNEVVAELTTIVIPEDAVSGVYNLYTGVYDPLTGDRLVAVTPEGEHLLHDELLLLQLTVLP